MCYTVYETGCSVQNAVTVFLQLYSVKKNHNMQSYSQYGINCNISYFVQQFMLYHQILALGSFNLSVQDTAEAHFQTMTDNANTYFPYHTVISTLDKSWLIWIYMVSRTMVNMKSLTEYILSNVIITKAKILIFYWNLLILEW